MPKLDFDHQTLIGIEAPDKPVTYYDTHKAGSGLMLRVSAAGTKTFSYRYRFNGKKRRYTIGKFPAVSLSQARSKVREIKVQVANGIDPQKEKQQRRTAPDPRTFRELANEFKDKHLPTLRESTRDEYERIIDVELVPKLGKYPIEEISKNQIMSLLDKKAYGSKPAPVMANRIRARLSKIYSFAVSRGLAEDNPVEDIPRYSKTNGNEAVEKKRNRYYEPEEIQDLWEYFSTLNEPTGSILKMLLVCGQRKTETMQMKWDDIKGDVWVIPAGLAKNKEQHLVPLPDLALQIIEDLRPLTGGTAYVFASPKLDNSPTQSLKRAVRYTKRDSGVKDFRPHDLRRTVATYMAGLGVDRTTLGKILNHKGLAGDGQVTAIYDRHEYMKEKRQAMSRWSSHLQKILAGEKDINIYKLG